MTLLSIAGRHGLRRNIRVLNQSSAWSKKAPSLAATSLQRRCLHCTVPRFAPEGEGQAAKYTERSNFWEEYRGSYNVSPPNFDFESMESQIHLTSIGSEITAVGHLTKKAQLSSNLVFGQISKGGLEQVQVIFRGPEAIKVLESIRLNSAISVTGRLQQKRAPAKRSRTAGPLSVAQEGSIFIRDVEIEATSITCLNSFDKEIPYASDHVYPATDRHLQIRFDEKLRNSLIFRSEVSKFARQALSDFHEIETPILFKSTPEGAHEFLVPTRRPGFTYALPQSPQQYKQILMASGINRYVQFARCFRDEGLRADRQPEFTQIDLEMAWTDGAGVMRRVEKFIKLLYGRFARPDTILPPLPKHHFLRMAYDEAMSKHGSDKPDLRIPGLIHRVDHLVPAELRNMITDLKDPIIEAYKLNLNETPKNTSKLLGTFFASTAGETFNKNPDGAPGIFVYDASKVPLKGLQPFGFEGAEAIEQLYETLASSPPTPITSSPPTPSNAHAETPFGAGDVLILQARPNLPHTGGSTTLGNLRRAMYKFARERDLIPEDLNHRYLWVTDFPMFTLEAGTEPGQGGTAGFSATHHPFTAPKTAEDVDLLRTDPLKAKADHYDLVVNGVELGGGSRRIHSAGMQEFVMREVLQMSPERIVDFSHLLKALSAGCPPHAGFAFGFDRLVAVMCGTESVRDVIAFPKNGNGDDVMVGSPREVSKEELQRYGMCVVSGSGGGDV